MTLPQQSRKLSQDTGPWHAWPLSIATRKRKCSKPYPDLNATPLKWFLKLQKKHSLQKYTHVQKRRTRGRVGLPTYDNKLEKISLLGRQRRPHGCHNFATSPPSLGDKIGEGAISTKPTTFLLSPNSTTLSSAAYLLSLLRHCADTPLAIPSSSLPTGDYSLYSFRPQKKSVHYHRRR